MKTSIGKTQLIARLINRAIMQPFLLPHKVKSSKPGELILSLSPEEKGILETCDEHDFNHRLPEDFFFKEYKNESKN